MSEKKNKERKRTNLLKYDATVEDPEAIIASDKDVGRRKAFQDTYKRIAEIIPNYFMLQKKRRKNTGGGTSLAQQITVTPNNVTLQVTENKENANIEKEEREI